IGEVDADPPIAALALGHLPAAIPMRCGLGQRPQPVEEGLGFVGVGHGHSEQAITAEPAGDTRSSAFSMEMDSPPSKLTRFAAASCPCSTRASKTPSSPPSGSDSFASLAASTADVATTHQTGV